MRRIMPLALFLLFPLVIETVQAGGQKGEKDIKIAGKLTNDDPQDKQRKAASQVHMVKLKAGKAYTMDMVSSEFDSYLRLEDAKGNQLAEDDDSGGNLNARIIFNCSKDGDYKVICTAFGPGGVGNYTLTVKTSGAAAKNTSAHEVLLGKAASDFQADFAVNGKAAKLSDLKGKVVLLEFCDARSDAFLDSIERLRIWKKSFKANDLAIVSVTFYPSEIGQKVAFDKATGKLTRADQGSKKTDQEALTALAAHHKLEHPLLVLSYEEALRVFDAYAVNGYPQAVLIDRQGIIRMIRVGDEKDATMLEGEIKKLAAQKKGKG